MTERSEHPPHSFREITAAILHPVVIVGALGYFVDVYDLILFAVVRVPSLKGLGFTGDELVSVGTWLINIQNAGMLAGGLLWGLLGDRFGRLKVLFGSIILYSLANLANGCVHDLNGYTLCRFFCGTRSCRRTWRLRYSCFRSPSPHAARFRHDDGVGHRGAWRRGRRLYRNSL